jgi:hypothetical protein
MKAYTIPRRRSFLSGLSINTILIVLNTAFFITFSILILINANFLNYIALKPANALSGKYLWTFITSMFMHGGIFHLLANMLSLFFLGSLVEKIVGGRRYLSFYLVAGLFAGIFFVAVSWILLQFGYASDFNTFAVGASGALFGLVGLLTILTPNLPVYIMFIPIPVKMKYAAPGILVLIWLISILGNVPVGNTAHLGGLITGIAYGIYLRKKYKKKTQYIRSFFS